MEVSLEPVHPYKYTLHPSPIHGIGVFAASWINTGDWIEKTIEKNRDGMRFTPFGRHINHCSIEFNVVLKEKSGGQYWNCAIRPILPNEEIVANYDLDSAEFPYVVGPAESFYTQC